MNNLIGNTPIIRIKYIYNNNVKYIYVKLEQYNLTGSIKDRMALYILEEEKKHGNLKDKMPIIEATSGNTGVSLSALGAKLGHPVYIFMPDWVSVERIKLMECYGATVFLISKEEGGFDKCIKLANDLAKKINGYRPNQFSNYLNTKCHYENTASEIIKELNNEIIGGFVSGIGSGANFIGAVLLSEFTNNPVVTIFPDDNKKYLSTDLVNKVNLKKEFISNKIKLLDYSVIKNNT